ncbi:MAG TPA: hypothetical protein DEP69_07570, partial [Acidimicrobiaceae bacterium]|nr:hypothetical protein [Acidimicrobiaceae bacterium]
DFEAAMTAYRQARSQPVQPDFPAVEMTHTAATAARLREALERQLADGIAFRYPSGQRFAADYRRVEVAGAAAELSGCTRYRAVEFESSSGVDVAVHDSVTAFTAQLALDADGRWRLDAYRTHPAAPGEPAC